MSSSWRSAQNVVEFCGFFGLPEEVQSHINLLCKGGNFVSEILSGMNEFFRFMRTLDQIDPKASTGISKLQSTGSKDDEDLLIDIYVKCIKRTGCPFVLKMHTNAYNRVLKEDFAAKLGDSSRSPQDDNMAKSAFDVEAEQPARKSAVSQIVWNKIVEYNEKYSHDHHGSPYTSIVGPSGIGKSRCMRDIAKDNRAYVIYTSLASEWSTAYPRRSDNADWLLKVQPMVSDQDTERASITTRFECFIAASLRQVLVCRRLGISPSDFYDMQVNDDDTKIQEFRKEIQDELVAMKDHVQRQFDQGINPEPVPKVSKVDADIDRIRELRDKPRSRANQFRSDEHDDSNPGDFDYGYYILNHLDNYQQGIEPLFKKFAKKKSKLPDAKPAVIFCFDEARELMSYRSLPFCALRRALRHQKKVNNDGDFFCVLLDTNTRYNVFVPATGLDPSQRIIQEPRNHFTPIFEIHSFDIMARRIKKEATINPAELFSFGRPIWGAYIKGSKKNVDSVVRLAMQKMYGGGNETIRNKEVLTSFMSARLPFNIIWHHLAETLVAYYMRMIYSVSDDRVILKTVQPSEPLLAWVAFKEVEYHNAKKQIIQNLWDQVHLGSIAIGDVGEMVACLILLYSFDKTQDANGLPEPRDLDSFMQSLFGGQFKKYTDGNQSDLWKKGLVFFNHFTYLDGNLTEDLLWKAWKRGAAYIAYRGTENFDLVLPVAMSKKNQIKCILVQVKNRKKDKLATSMRDDATRIMKEVRGSQDQGVDVCALFYMALRTNGDARIEFHEVPEAPPTLKTKHSMFSLRRIVSKKTNSGNIVHPVVVACGLSENLYPGLVKDGNGKEIADLYRGLLNMQDSEKYMQKTDYQKTLSPLFND